MHRNKKGMSIRFNVLQSRKVRRVASNIDRVLGLINANPINAHSRWECQFAQVDLSKVHRQTKIGNKVLSDHQMMSLVCINELKIITIGSMEIGRACISVCVSGPIPGPRRVQAAWPSLIQVT